MTLRNRLLVPLSAVVVATLVAALAVALTRGTSDRGRPALLRLAGAGAASTMSAEVAPAAGSADARSSASGAYRLTGDLPDGRPDDTPVYALAGPYDTSRLARVLDPQGLGRDRAAWWWSQPQPCSVPPAPAGKPEIAPAPDPAVAPDTPTSSDGSADSSGSAGKDAPCAVSGSGSGASTTVTSGSATSGAGSAPNAGTEPAPEPKPAVEPARPTEPALPPMPHVPPSPEPTEPAMTQDQARAAAKPVFEAVGLPVADAAVTVSPWGASVWLNPVVHGLPTSGYATRVEIGTDRKVTYASGFLGEPSAGDRYPLMTADQAFDRIEAAAVTDMMCRVGPDGKGCLPPEPQDVTGAQLGLSLQQTSKGEQLLVPAWLFEVKGWTEPLPQVAVEPAYVGPGEEDTTGTAPGSSDPGSADSTQGSTAGSTEPMPPAVTPKG